MWAFYTKFPMKWLLFNSPFGTRFRDGYNHFAMHIEISSYCSMGLHIEYDSFLYILLTYAFELTSWVRHAG